MPVTRKCDHENQQRDDNEPSSFERVNVRPLVMRRLGVKLALWSGCGHENIVAPIGC
jgi:hypothetical protein